jgi:hypothetical protein
MVKLHVFSFKLNKKNRLSITKGEIVFLKNQRTKNRLIIIIIIIIA